MEREGRHQLCISLRSACQPSPVLSGWSYTTTTTTPSPPASSISLALQVLVMEAGLVKEFDSVPRLMGRQQSTFKSMVIEAGLEGASGNISRVASLAALAAAAKSSGSASPPAASDSPPQGALSPAAGGRPVQGLPTFVRRLKDDYDLKE